MNPSSESIGVVTASEEGEADFELQRAVYGNTPSDVYDSNTILYLRMIKKNATEGPITVSYTVEPEGIDPGFALSEDPGRSYSSPTGIVEFGEDMLSPRYISPVISFSRGVTDPEGYDLRSMRLVIREGGETGEVLAEDSCVFRVNAVKRTVYVLYDPSYGAAGGTNYLSYSILSPDREILAKSASAVPPNTAMDPFFTVPARADPCLVVVTSKFGPWRFGLALDDRYAAEGALAATSAPPANSAASPIEVPLGGGVEYLIQAGEKHYFRVHTR